MDILARAEGFFLDAMAQGWAAQVAPKSMPQSDWVQIAVEDPIWGFKLTDSWGNSMGANKPVGISLSSGRSSDCVQQEIVLRGSRGESLPR